MGRGRGKGKKYTVTSHDDTASGDEEKIPAQKRRGRPQKLMVDEIDEEIERIEEEEEESENGVSNKEMKSLTGSDNGTKRRRNNIQAKEKSTDSVKEEENSNGTILSSGDLVKPTNGFRHNSSRRKSTPRRAAEAGVECVCAGEKFVLV